MLGDAFACLTKECRTPAILVAHEMPENLRKIAVDHAMASEGRLEICYLEACGPASPSCEPASNHSQQGEPSIPTSLNKNNSPGSNQRL
jgi:hypothetical protein